MCQQICLVRPLPPPRSASNAKMAGLSLRCLLLDWLIRNRPAAALASRLVSRRLLAARLVVRPKRRLNGISSNASRSNAKAALTARCPLRSAQSLTGHAKVRSKEGRQTRAGSRRRDQPGCTLLPHAKLPMSDLDRPWKSLETRPQSSSSALTAWPCWCSRSASSG